LRYITVEYRSISAVSNRPKTEALVGVNSTRESVSGSESLVNKWTFRIVRIKLVGKHRKFGEATDSQRSAFTFRQQVEIHHAFFNQSHGAVQSRDSFTDRLELIVNRIRLDLTELRVQRVDKLYSIA